MSQEVSNFTTVIGFLDLHTLQLDSLIPSGNQKIRRERQIREKTDQVL